MEKGEGIVSLFFLGCIVLVVVGMFAKAGMIKEREEIMINIDEEITRLSMENVDEQKALGEIDDLKRVNDHQDGALRYYGGRLDVMADELYVFREEWAVAVPRYDTHYCHVVRENEIILLKCKPKRG